MVDKTRIYQSSPEGIFHFNWPKLPNIPVGKVGQVFPMVVSVLPKTKFGQNDHRKDAPYFII